MAAPAIPVTSVLWQHRNAAPGRVSAVVFP
jgi:hypothetical protein